MNPKIIAVCFCAAGLAMSGVAGGQAIPQVKTLKSVPPGIHPMATESRASFQANKLKAVPGIRGLDVRDLDELFLKRDEPRFVYSQPPSVALPSEGHFHDEWFPSITFRF